MTKQHIKKILISILIGAVTAFLTSLFDGLLDFLKSDGNNIAGGIASTATYLAKGFKA